MAAIANQGLLECMELTEQQENMMRSWTSKNDWSTNKNKKDSQDDFRLEWKGKHNQQSNMGSCSQGHVQTILMQTGSLKNTMGIPLRGDS